MCVRQRQAGTAAPGAVTAVGPSQASRGNPTPACISCFPAIPTRCPRQGPRVPEQAKPISRSSRLLRVTRQTVTTKLAFFLSLCIIKTLSFLAYSTQPTCHAARRSPAATCSPSWSNSWLDLCRTGRRPDHPTSLCNSGTKQSKHRHPSLQTYGPESHFSLFAIL